MWLDEVISTDGMVKSITRYDLFPLQKLEWELVKGIQRPPQLHQKNSLHEFSSALGLDLGLGDQK